MKNTHTMSFEEFEQHMSAANEQHQIPESSPDAVFLGMVEENGETMAMFGNVLL